MRAYLLSSVLAATTVLAVAPAAAFVTSYGSSLARACYKSSLATYTTPAAVKECSRALDEEPLYPRDRVATLINRGIVLMNLGDYGLAEADFNQAIAMDSAYPESYLNKGFLRLRQDRAIDAIVLIDEALAKKALDNRPLDKEMRDKRAEWPALAYYARSMANEQLGNFRAAYNDLQKARQLAPSWSLPERQLARYSVQSR
jgi:tetratricopeptide (TPR) repeat protein